MYLSVYSVDEDNRECSAFHIVLAGLASMATAMPIILATVFTPL